MTKQIYKGKTSLFKEIYLNRIIIYELTRREFKIMYSNKHLGLLWAILEPIAIMFILALVFTYLRGGGKDGEYPFPVFLLSGVTGFNFFSNSLNRATQSIRQNKYIVGRGQFSSSLLPFVSIFFNLQTHVIILAVSSFIFAGFGVYPSWYWFQLLYYFFATSMLLLGLTWITSSLILFVKDLQYIISIFTRALFFLTPIFWDISIFPPNLKLILKLNPMYHIVDGYRSCFLYHEPFWTDKYALIAFWSFTIIVLIFGRWFFNRLEPHFDDVI
ncbi:ABC transporter permease [Lentimicrobium sp. S6]|uniref:ABC transporter permease n=1 Tax=Lentimicrobium sp. S6 TaxID=2735872 RepID=UPI00155609D3|nr:ABC transporter permease [Lentimicrobium sp. S6]NPD47859.1 ABC transporter permease [Lentimicrobium sp. S6]